MGLFTPRCVAVREPKRGELLIDTFWGRCDLDRGHDGLHELERGMIVVRWDTEWVIDGSKAYQKAYWQSSALEDAADDIQALHPGEKKNSVEWLRDRAKDVLRKVR